jgi:hypothetical protein
MTDQNNSQNNAPVPAGQPSPYSQNNGQQVLPSNVVIIPPVANNVPSGQWITFTYTGNNWVTDPVPADPVEKKEKKTRAKNEPDGCTCKKCKEFYQYAEPNQEDGTLICYSCRTYG